MNFSQLHERLRIEMVGRINRGQLTGTLLAAQTGLRAPHISNFLRKKRRFSLNALDRVLAAQQLSIEDLMPETRRSAVDAIEEDNSIVPLVAHSTALHSPIINRRLMLGKIHLTAGALDDLRPRRTFTRRNWQRFVAVRLTAAQAWPMEPVLHAGTVAVLDRHYNSLAPNRPPHPNIYSVNFVDTLVFRYVSYEANRIILRPYALDAPIELLRLGADESPSACIVGRVCVTINEI